MTSLANSNPVESTGLILYRLQAVQAGFHRHRAAEDYAAGSGAARGPSPVMLNVDMSSRAALSASFIFANRAMMRVLLARAFFISSLRRTSSADGLGLGTLAGALGSRGARGLRAGFAEVGSDMGDCVT